VKLLEIESSPRGESSDSITAGLTAPLSLLLNSPLGKFRENIKPDQNLTNVLRHHEIN
jgi:hypothetical protein